MAGRTRVIGIGSRGIGVIGIGAIGAIGAMTGIGAIGAMTGIGAIGPTPPKIIMPRLRGRSPARATFIFTSRKRPSE
jgi:hypothetical protein